MFDPFLKVFLKLFLIENHIDFAMVFGPEKCFFSTNKSHGLPGGETNLPRQGGDARASGAACFLGPDFPLPPARSEGPGHKPQTTETVCRLTKNATGSSEFFCQFADPNYY